MGVSQNKLGDVLLTDVFRTSISSSFVLKVRSDAHLSYFVSERSEMDESVKVSLFRGIRTEMSVGVKVSGSDITSCSVQPD